MDRIIKKIDFSEVVSNKTRSDLRIGEDILLLDKYTLDPVFDYEFTAVNNTFIEVIEGFGSVEINSVPFEVKSPCIIAFLNGQRIKTNIASKDTYQRSVVFSERFMEDLHLSLLKLNDIRATIIENPVISLDEDALHPIDVYTEAIQGIALKPNRGTNLDCAKFFTLALLYGPLFDTFKRKTESETFRAPSISSKFFDMIQENVKEEHRIIYYASRLNISERYLYIAVKTATGKSPGYWIDYYLISEAKKLLANRDLSIQQIVEILGFSSLSAFGKFFRRMENTCPQDFRKRLTTHK